MKVGNVEEADVRRYSHAAIEYDKLSSLMVQRPGSLVGSKMITDDRMLFDELAALGAGDIAHLNGSLEAHLTGVFHLLREWRADEAVCVAGLYHATYGTAGFDDAMVSLDQRARIASVVGIEAEEIIYTYCACDRPVVWPQIGTEAVVTFRNRFTGAEHVLDGKPLNDFCELSCANEMELALSDPSFVKQTSDVFGPLFRAWAPFLSSSANCAVEREYPMLRSTG